jgi:flavin-dependent dehydrogenase
MYDAIVIGARCAGAATAMLLARSGQKVLLVDRAALPSDIPHGHFIHQHGPARLARWGVLDRILATNCPAVTSMTSYFGDHPLTGHDLEVDGVPLGIAPRRAQLDHVLVEAAVEAGAELRDRFAVLDFTSQGGRVNGIVGRDARTGARVTEQATVVVGADGRNSGLARHVKAPEYESAPTATCWYFSYYTDLACPGLELYAREGRDVTFVFPTNDELVGIFVGFPMGELAAVRADIEGHVMATLDAIPQIAERARAASREERFYGATQLPNFLRKPYGPGWALVGDAGCHKDPFMALGICDALRDAEFLADAMIASASGGSVPDEAFGVYERRRNEATLPDYRINLALSQLGSLPEQYLRLRSALRSDQAATNHFFLANEGMVAPETFFNDENIGAIMAGAGAVPS